MLKNWKIRATLGNEKPITVSGSTKDEALEKLADTINKNSLRKIEMESKIKADCPELANVISQLDSEDCKEIQRELAKLIMNLRGMGYSAKERYAIIFSMGVDAGKRKAAASNKIQLDKA